VQNDLDLKKVVEAYARKVLSDEELKLFSIVFVKR
jgi:hypothetical protein